MPRNVNRGEQMRIGILPFLSTGAGVYQYSLTMLEVLHSCRGNGSEDEFVVFANGVHRPAVLSQNGPGWTVEQLRTPSFKRLAKEMLQRLLGEARLIETWERYRRWSSGVVEAANPDTVRLKPHLGRWFRRFGVELMLYPAQHPLSFEMGIPYVMAIHDLQHRLQPEFPEVSAFGEWERREYLFRNGIRYATLLMADSEVGKEDILEFYGEYGVTSERVKVLPFLPATYLAKDVPEGEQQRVRASYGLPERYLFYPAQFWPHKNHARLIQALGLLKERHGLKIPIVFSGSYTGLIRRQKFREAMSLARQLGLEEGVRYLGYVPDEDMAGLYAGTAGLVMPTFFGPTNIPVLEAWAFGCPVLTSDIRGIREQAGDAAILVDPRSVEAIADGIYHLWSDEVLARTLADRGRQRLAGYTREDYQQRLFQVLEEAKERAGLG